MGFHEYFGCEVVRPEHLKEEDGVMEMIENANGYGRILDESLLEEGFSIRFPRAYDRFSTKVKVVNAIVYNRVYSHNTTKKICL